LSLARKPISSEFASSGSARMSSNESISTSCRGCESNLEPSRWSSSKTGFFPRVTYLCRLFFRTLARKLA
jgi:hypothetical protein